MSTGACSPFPLEGLSEIPHGTTLWIVSLLPLVLEEEEEGDMLYRAEFADVNVVMTKKDAAMKKINKKRRGSVEGSLTGLVGGVWFYMDGGG